MDQLQELFDTLEEVFNTIDEETLEDATPQMLNEIAAHLMGPDAAEAFAAMAEYADLNDYAPGQLVQEINDVRNVLRERLEELTLKHVGSAAATHLLDELESILDAYFSTAILYANGRETTTVGVELVSPFAKLPTYAHQGDQGADIYAIEDTIIEPFTFGNMVPTGLKLKIPQGWAVSIRPRSGLSKNTPLRISNSPATIDQQYRGEVKILFDNFSSEPIEIKAGERIAQFVLEKNYPANWKEVEFVDAATDRAEGGFGSSGK